MDNITNKMKKKMLLLLLPFLASCERTYPGRPTLSMDKEKLADLFTNVKSINDKLAYRVRVGKSEKDAYFYEDKNKNIVGEISDVDGCYYILDGRLYTGDYYTKDPSSKTKPSEYLEKNLSVEQIANLMFEKNNAEIVISSNDLFPFNEDLFLKNEEKWLVSTEYPIKSIYFWLTEDEFKNCGWNMKDSFIALLGGEKEYETWLKKTFVIRTKEGLKGEFSIFVSDEDDRLYPGMNFGAFRLYYWE